MNVFLHELKMRLKGQIGWIIAIVVFMVLSVVKFNTLSVDASASEALLKQFPATIQALFGMTGLNISTLSGYFGVLFIYILVILAIHAGMLGAGVLADEERDKTTEFLFVKPRGRSLIVTQKLLAGLVYIALLWAVVVASTLVSTINLAGNAEFTKDFWNFMAAVFVVQLMTYAFGSFAAALTNNPRFPTRLVAIVVFVSYLMFALYKLSPNLDFLKYISFFLFFDAADIIHHGALQIPYVGLCGLITLLCIIGTYLFYKRRDLNV